MRLIGSVEVGRTELEMELPILVKNLLNLSAMHDGSDICFPSTVIFSILELDFAPTVASFKISHVFWGFLHFRSSCLQSIWFYSYVVQCYIGSYRFYIFQHSQVKDNRVLFYGAYF